MTDAVGLALAINAAMEALGLILRAIAAGQRTVSKADLDAVWKRMDEADAAFDAADEAARKGA